MSTAAPELHREAAVDVPMPVGTTTPPAKRTPLWVWLLVVVIVAGAGALVAWRIHAVRAASAAANDRGSRGGKGGGGHELPVVVATVRRGDLPVYLRGLGTVTPLKTVNLRSRVDGQITEIPFTEGQHVKAGDFLIQIDPRPYQAALDQAKGQLARDQATFDSADWNVKQDQEALKTKAIAEQQLHTDTAARDGATGAIEVDRANIDAAQVNLDYCHVTSPIDGVIGLRLVDVGNIVHASDTSALVVITQLQPITVLFTLPEGELDQLQKRMHSAPPVPVDAYNWNLRERLAHGTVLALDSAIDPTTLTIKVRAQFDNADNALYPSQAVNARVLVDTVRAAVLVPSAAIQTNAAGEPFVYVCEGDDPKVKTVKVRQVTEGPKLAAVGPDESDTTAITDGLEPGDVVVTDGVDKLTDGTKVSPRAADDRRHGSTRPTTAAAEGSPVNETNVGGPQAGRSGGGGGTTRPSSGTHHRRGGPPANAS